MPRKTGSNPGKPRHLLGVPRIIGPTLVNGEEVQVENPHKAISRMYQTVDRTRNGAGELIWERMAGRHLPEHRRTCHTCGLEIRHTQIAVLHRRKKSSDRSHHWSCQPPTSPLR